jgi:hypothetical protein
MTIKWQIELRHNKSSGSICLFDGKKFYERRHEDKKDERGDKNPAYSFNTYVEARAEAEKQAKIFRKSIDPNVWFFADYLIEIFSIWDISPDLNLCVTRTCSLSILKNDTKDFFKPNIPLRWLRSKL